MEIVNAKAAPLTENPHRVKARKLYDTENAQVVHITLEPGESLKKHITPVDVLFYVVEGTGVVEIGDEKEQVGQDTLVPSPAKIPHCWHNESSEVLRFLVVKLPRSVAPADLV